MTPLFAFHPPRERLKEYGWFVVTHKGTFLSHSSVFFHSSMNGFGCEQESTGPLGIYQRGFSLRKITVAVFIPSGTELCYRSV